MEGGGRETEAQTPVTTGEQGAHGLLALAAGRCHCPGRAGLWEMLTWQEGGMKSLRSPEGPGVGV